MTGASWTFRPVSPENWGDMEALFEGRGGPKTCWCMVWRKDVAGSAGPAKASDRHAAMAGLVQSGRPVGLLGYDQTTPVAWCSIAPRALFSKSLSPSPPDPGLWSLTCFFIRTGHRNQSGFGALLVAAEIHATAHGATAIEAYPVAPDSPSYRFSGFLPSFEKAGYKPIDRIGLRRNIVRKALGPQ